MVAPFRYAPLSLATPAQAAEVTSGQAAGAYKIINHGKDIDATLKASESMRLNSDGTASGAVTGTWIHRGNNQVDLVLSGVTYHGVLSRQWNSNANAFTVTFTAQNADGVSLWGARTGN